MNHMPDSIAWLSMTGTHHGTKVNAEVMCGSASQDDDLIGGRIFQDYEDLFITML